jgi:hypothetical protein
MIHTFMKQLLIQIDEYKLSEANPVSSIGLLDNQKQLSCSNKLKGAKRKWSDVVEPEVDFENSLCYKTVESHDEIIANGNRFKDMQKKKYNNMLRNSQEDKDQLLLHQNKIYLPVNHIVDSNSNEFNDILKRFNFSEDQFTLIKDIRRRGKNKIAAQICRKRKIDSIESLTEAVEFLDKKELFLEDEQEAIENEVKFQICLVKY